MSPTKELTDTLPVEIWDIDRLWAHPKNAKKHPADQIKKLAKSIKRFGLANVPHIEPDGCIIAGTGRWLAFRDEIKAKKIPVIVRHDLTKDQADALRLADNNTFSTDYDMEVLRGETLRLGEIDPSLIEDAGFDIKELERLSDISVDKIEIDDGVMVEDITEAVETQKAENKAKEAEVDATAAPIADAFGFKRMSVEQSRVVREWMSGVELDTGKTGAEALVEWIKEHPSL